MPWHAPATIRTFLLRNEQAAAFAADGARGSPASPGVVCTTAGPGATNALTGVAECWADSVPILLLAGQVNADALDRECGNYHEIDLEGIFRPVTKWCGTLRRVDQIPALVGRAFEAMTRGRPRPSALFLPQDLMRVALPGRRRPSRRSRRRRRRPCRRRDRRGRGDPGRRPSADHPGRRRRALVGRGRRDRRRWPDAWARR